MHLPAKHHPVESDFIQLTPPRPQHLKEGHLCFFVRIAGKGHDIPKGQADSKLSISLVAQHRTFPVFVMAPPLFNPVQSCQGDKSHAALLQPPKAVWPQGPVEYPQELVRLPQEESFMHWDFPPSILLTTSHTGGSTPNFTPLHH